MNKLHRELLEMDFIPLAMTTFGYADVDANSFINTDDGVPLKLSQ